MGPGAEATGNATAGGVFDPAEAAVAVMAVTIQELRERRAARRRDVRLAGAPSPWVLAGRVAAMTNRPR
jgi:hypothetical protein